VLDLDVSNYTTIQTDMVSVEYLVEALRDMGIRGAEVYDVAEPIYHWSEGKGIITAEVIVQGQYLPFGCRSIGFKRGDDRRFIALIRRSDRNRLNEKWVLKLTEHYNQQVAAGTLEERDRVSQLRRKKEPIKIESKWRLKEKEEDTLGPKRFIQLQQEESRPNRVRWKWDPFKPKKK
jgi:hypothetical protein